MSASGTNHHAETHRGVVIYMDVVPYQSAIDHQIGTAVNFHALGFEVNIPGECRGRPTLEIVRMIMIYRTTGVLVDNCAREWVGRVIPIGKLLD
jgi:hypothetical protein